MKSKKTGIIAGDKASGSISVAIIIFVKRDPWHIVSAYWYAPTSLDPSRESDLDRMTYGSTKLPSSGLFETEVMSPRRYQISGSYQNVRLSRLAIRPSLTWIDRIASR